MNNELIFIRHAKTKKDTNIPIQDWTLSEEGFEQAEGIANSMEFGNADILISSNQNKAYLTIEPLANRLNEKIIKIEELGEIKRPNSEKLSTEEYDDIKKKMFENLDYTEKGWETANHALNRFKEAVDKIDRKYENKKIIICSHGTVMSLYFAYLVGKLTEVISRRKTLEFGSYGIIKDNKVMRDII